MKVKSHNRNPCGVCFGYKTHHAMSHAHPTNINGQSFPRKCITFSTLLLEILLYYSLLLEGSLKPSRFVNSNFYQLYLLSLTSAEHLDSRRCLLLYTAEGPPLELHFLLSSLELFNASPLYRIACGHERVFYEFATILGLSHVILCCRLYS